MDGRSLAGQLPDFGTISDPFAGTENQREWLETHWLIPH
jgi:hypothetical protein